MGYGAIEYNRIINEAMKTKKFLYNNVALCKECGGKGVMEDGSRCTVCNGSGRVLVVKEGHITVTAFKDGNRG